MVRSRQDSPVLRLACPLATRLRHGRGGRPWQMTDDRTTGCASGSRSRARTPWASSPRSCSRTRSSTSAIARAFDAREKARPGPGGRDGRAQPPVGGRSRAPDAPRALGLPAPGGHRGRRRPPRRAARRSLPRRRRSRTRLGAIEERRSPTSSRTREAAGRAPRRARSTAAAPRAGARRARSGSSVAAPRRGHELEESRPARPARSTRLTGRPRSRLGSAPAAATQRRGRSPAGRRARAASRVARRPSTRGRDARRPRRDAAPRGRRRRSDRRRLQLDRQRAGRRPRRRGGAGS